MSRSALPNSTRKFLRKEKSRLRREILDPEEAKRKVQELMEKIFKEQAAAKNKPGPKQ